MGLLALKKWGSYLSFCKCCHDRKCNTHSFLYYQHLQVNFVIKLLCNWLILRLWYNLGESIRSALVLTLLCIPMYFNLYDKDLSRCFKIVISNVIFLYSTEEDALLQIWKCRGQLLLQIPHVQLQHYLLGKLMTKFCFRVNACTITHKHASSANHV